MGFPPERPMFYVLRDVLLANDRSFKQRCVTGSKGQRRKTHGFYYRF